jgi:hypothetical protein
MNSIQGHEKDEESEDEKSEEKKTEKDGHKKKDKSFSPSESTQDLLPNDDNSKDPHKREEKREYQENKEEKEAEEKMGCLTSTSLSMNYLVEGWGTIPPFTKIVVDVRDSLGYQMKTRIPKMNVGEREELSGTVGYFVSVGSVEMMRRQEGLVGLRCLSPENILFSVEGTITINSVDLCGIENEKASLESSEYLRYSSPEVLKGEIVGATEKSVVFSLGMIMYGILNQQFPFDGESCHIAGGLILVGDRPGMEKVRENHGGWVELVEDCWNASAEERPNCHELEESLKKLNPNLFPKIAKKKKKKKKKNVILGEGKEGVKIGGEREREGEGDRE